MDENERKVTTLMLEQRGLVTRSQALDLGMTTAQIKSRLRTERWVRVAPGTFLTAGVSLDWRGRAHAVCLQRSDALVSHRTAAAIAGVGPPFRVPEVTVSYGCQSRSNLALIHRARVDPIDQQTFDGLPTTALPRTLVDCAAILGPVSLRKLVDSAMHEHRWLTARAVDDAWERAQRRPGRQGWSKLDAALHDWRLPIRPGSPAELRLLRLVTSWGYPEPERQVAVTDPTGQVIARLDVGWSPKRLGIEYDSDRWHDPTRWAADELRSARLEALGWTILHADKLDLRPGSARLRNALDRSWPRSDRHAA